MGTNSAETATSDVRTTVQVPVPAQAAPLQPAKAEPAAGVAVRVMVVPPFWPVVQVAPQLIAAGTLVMVPTPVPVLLTERLNNGGGGGPKFAVTERSLSRVTLHAPVPVQDPDHPVKAKPAAGTTVSATGVPLMKVVEQAVPQAMPLGVLMIAPPVAGLGLTASVRASGAPGDLTAVPPPALLPLSDLAGAGPVPPPPPHAVRIKMSSAAAVAPSTDLHPPTRITNSSCRVRLPGARLRPRRWRGSDYSRRQGEIKVVDRSSSYRYCNSPFFSRRLRQ